MEKKNILYYDSSGEIFGSKDSRGGKICVSEILRGFNAEFLQKEADKAGIEHDISEWEYYILSGHAIQKNGYNCGMFMLMFCDFYSKGSALDFDQGSALDFDQEISFFS